jgi:glycosyltransferase involved in cell wall biosynthesis
MAVNRIQIIKIGRFSYTNENVIKHVKKHFPDYEFEIIDILSILKKNKLIIIVNIYYVLKEYLNEFLSGQKSIFKLKKYLYGTTYIFNKFNSIIKSHQRDKSYKFIFQFQGLCNASLKGVPLFIYTDHTNLANLSYPHINHADYLRTDNWISLEKQLYHNATLIFTMSSNITQSLIKQYDIIPDSIKQVMAGINIPKNSFVAPKNYQNKNILFVGVDWKRKGGPLLIEVFKEVLNIIPDATLTIVGCKPDVKVKNCHIAGRIPLDQVQNYYNKATVFCLPTIREPFGLVFLEAMYNKLPVVTNNIGATSDFIRNGGNGFLLNNRKKEYTKTLIRLLNSPDLCKEMGEQGHRIVYRRYTWDNVGSLIAKNIKNKLRI